MALLIHRVDCNSITSYVPDRALTPSLLVLIVLCRVGKQVVNVPSFMVRIDSQKHIEFGLTSPFSGTGRPGRVKRKNMQSKGNGDDDDE